MITSPATSVTPHTHIIGAGLIGASIGIGLTTEGWSVTIEDADAQSESVAQSIGAGSELAGDVKPDLVIVAVPPALAGEVVTAALFRWDSAVVTDVASVKAIVLTELRAHAAETGLDLSRYVGSHPMAGRERSGAGAASADLFLGRPWVVAPHEHSSSAAVLAVRTLAADLGAAAVSMDASEHDDAVAVVSHLPQLMASLTAARLVDAPDASLALAGQGLRDVTRIAASDPRLWSAILTGNAPAVLEMLRGVRTGLEELIEAFAAAAEHGPLAPGAVAGISAVIGAGNEGVAKVPGKHGGTRKRYAEVSVLVPDEPGELGRLFSEVGEIGVNIEDFQMEHSPKQKVGMAIVSVMPTAAAGLEAALDERGWRVVAP